MNPKYRDKAAKIIQSWWRELKNIYNYRIKQIIKIQSAFRGKFVRKYMYDLFYLNFLYISFCKKIETVLKIYQTKIKKIAVKFVNRLSFVVSSVSETFHENSFIVKSITRLLLYFG